MLTLYNDIVVHLRLRDQADAARLPAFLSHKALRSYKTNDDFWIIVFGGEVFFGDDLLKDETLETLIKTGELQVTFDLATYLPEDKVAQTTQLPQALVLAAARLQADLLVSTYVTSPEEPVIDPSTLS